MVILSSPSGAGKTTLVKLLSERKGFITSISHTTRTPRSNEVEGKDYHFVSIEKFEKMIDGMNDMEELLQTGKEAIDALNQWEGNVVQTKMETFQDVVNFLNRLNSHMINLLGTIDGSDPPLTQGQIDRYSDLTDEWYNYKKKLDGIIDEQIRSYNELYRLAGLPAIIIKD